MDGASLSKRSQAIPSPLDTMLLLHMAYQNECKTIETAYRQGVVLPRLAERVETFGKALAGQTLESRSPDLVAARAV